MTATDLLNVLRGHGVMVDVAGNRLRLDAPKGALTTELRAALMERKEEILDLLKPFDDEAGWRVEEMVKQIPNEGQIPFLIARRSTNTAPNCCHSCGDFLIEASGYVCRPCRRAQKRALEIAMSNP